MSSPKTLLIKRFVVDGQELTMPPRSEYTLPLASNPETGDFSLSIGENGSGMAMKVKYNEDETVDIFILLIGDGCDKQKSDNVTN